MTRRPSIAAGAILAGLVVGCVALPLILPDLPPPDPVHGSLLAPGTRVTALNLHDGRTVVGPGISWSREGATVPGRAGTTMIPADTIVDVRQFRFWLGSDRLGRDVLRDILIGGRLSLGIAAASVAIALLLGLAIGLTAATGGPVVDTILMRAVDGLLAFPVLFLVILIAALVRPGAGTLIPILGLTSWMGLARLVRGQVLSLRHRDYVRAAEAAGVRWHQIWRWHFLPHLAGPVGQDVALRTGDLVLAEATLSYLGIGVPATVPTWGAMVRDGHRVMLDGWWLSALPGLCIASLVVSLALVADHVRARTEG